MTSLYVLERTDGAYKIGISSDVINRASCIQHENKRLISYVVEFPGLEPKLARKIEWTAHNLLREWSMGGEWFLVNRQSAVSAAHKALLMVEGSDLSLAINPHLYAYRGAFPDAIKAGMKSGLTRKDALAQWQWLCGILDKFETGKRRQSLAYSRAIWAEVRTKRGVRVGRLPALTPDQKKEARLDWDNEAMSSGEVAAKWGVSRPTLHSYFGPRFQKPPTPRRQRKKK